MSTVFRVEKSRNYTVLSNVHLFDERLSLKATTLMSLMLALPPSWDYTLTGLASLKRDGLDSVRAGITELEKYGYLTRARTRNEFGQVQGPEYIVYETPEQNPNFKSKPTLENPIQVKNEKNEPTWENPTQEIPTQDKPIWEIPTQLSTNISNTNQLSTNQLSTNLSINQKKNDLIDTIDSYKKIIQENIDYDVLRDIHSNEINILDELVELMADTMSSSEEIRIAKKTVPVDTVRNRFLKIDSDHIDYVIESITNNTTEIKNIKAYMLTALYNAPMTFDTHLTAKVNHDMHNSP